MAFNADKYIDVIVKQIAKNFQALHKAVEACKELEKNEKKFRSTYDLLQYAKLEEKRR